MRVYRHQEGQYDVEAVNSAPDAVISKALNLVEGEVLLIEDSDDLVEATLTFEQAGILDRGHVFQGRGHRIEVVVTFNGEPREREFSASRRVEGVFHWATGEDAFDLSGADAAEHQLALASDDTVPPGDVHLGSLPQDPPGVVKFNLIPKHRHEG